MERLTVNGCKFLTPWMASKNELLDEIRRHQKYYDRLAAYEDTNLTPSDIADLKAENERLKNEIQGIHDAIRYCHSQCEKEYLKCFDFLEEEPK